MGYGEDMEKEKVLKKKIKYNWADFLINFSIALLCVVVVYPMYYILILSISEPAEAVKMSAYILPKGLYFDTYQLFLEDTSLWRSYAYTIFYAAITCVLMEITCVLMAYPLTCKSLYGKKFLTFFLLIPMYFSGGMIPEYLVYTKLGLYNNIWSLIVPGAFSIWNIILTRTYMNSIPDTMKEAAKIDGANHFDILGRIYVPLSKPIMAVIAIYTVVGVWNSWFRSMVYQTDMRIQPLQMYLRRVLITQTVDITDISAEEAAALAEKLLSNLQMRYAMIIFTTLPILFIYPFFQRYFVKGVMVGSLKG
jgi:putative aldouronate transport system permease protein